MFEINTSEEFSTSQQQKAFDYVTPLGFLIHLATKRGAKVKVLIDQAAASELN